MGERSIPERSSPASCSWPCRANAPTAIASCPDAVARGAAALLVTRPPEDLAALGDATVVRVADALAALHAVAAGWRTRFDPLVVGVTGSIAKTSAKEAIATVLGTRFRTLKNEGNQNNEVGLPLTVLKLGPEHEAAVLEMGMYVGGEIADLARIGRPSIGVVTAVQAVHLSRIGSLRAIERAKGELLEALPPSGTAILNADDPIVRGMYVRTVARSATYGFAEDADVRAVEVESAGLAGMRFTLVAPRRAPPGDHPDARSTSRSTTHWRRPRSGSPPGSTSTRSPKGSHAAGRPRIAGSWSARAA